MAVTRPLTHALQGTSVTLPEGQPLLTFEGVELSFGGTRAIDHVSFDVEPGELFAIIGPNGAGKTSILNCLSGAYKPQEGRIEFLGHDLRAMHPPEIARLGMSRMFQNIALFDNLNVVDNLLLGRHTHVEYRWFQSIVPFGAARREELRHREVVEEIVDFLEITQYRTSPVGMLPYGVKKRVELGRALALEPKLLLLDEPVAGMNVEETEDMARFILDIQSELGVAMILVEHDMGLVMDLADRVLVVDFGKPVALDVPARVQENPDVISAYLGQEHQTREAP